MDAAAAAAAANDHGANNSNNYRRYNKRGGNSNPKSKKQLENELHRQRSFFVGSPQSHAATATATATTTTTMTHGGVQQGGHLNRSSSGVIGQKKHPTLAIYRPPSVRGDINNNSDNVYIANGLQKSKNIKDVPDALDGSGGKLNVHAKEFSLERSNTAPQSIMNGAKPESTQHGGGGGGGGGSVLSRSRTFYTNGEYKPNNQKKNFENKGYKNYNFQQFQQKNAQYKETQGQKVQFKEPPKRKSKPTPTDENANKHVVDAKYDYGLRRSKSYNGPDSKHYHQNDPEDVRMAYKYQSNEFSFKDLNCFPEDINDMARRIVKDTKNSPTKDLMLLALKIIEYAVSKQDALDLSVKLSLYIIERDTRDTYVNMIINTIQLWFVKREKLLQPPTKFFLYATFVLQMYKGMKENKVLLSRMEKEVYSRKQTLLMLLFKICEHCLTPGKEQYATEEIECLFNIVDAVGRDLEQEVPETLRQLYVSIRDAVLTRDCPSSAKRILLHLIELAASKWTLPPTTMSYYNSKTERLERQ